VHQLEDAEIGTVDDEYVTHKYTEKTEDQQGQVNRQTEQHLRLCVGRCVCVCVSVCVGVHMCAGVCVCRMCVQLFNLELVAVPVQYCHSSVMVTVVYVCELCEPCREEFDLSTTASLHYNTIDTSTTTHPCSILGLGLISSLKVQATEWAHTPYPAIRAGQTTAEASSRPNAHRARMPSPCTKA